MISFFSVSQFSQFRQLCQFGSPIWTVKFFLIFIGHQLLEFPIYIGLTKFCIKTRKSPIFDLYQMKSSNQIGGLARMAEDRQLFRSRVGTATSRPGWAIDDEFRNIEQGVLTSRPANIHRLGGFNVGLRPPFSVRIFSDQIFHTSRFIRLCFHLNI